MSKKIGWLVLSRFKVACLHFFHFFAKKVVEIFELKLPKNHPDLINAKMGLKMVEEKLKE